MGCATRETVRIAKIPGDDQDYVRHPNRRKQPLESYAKGDKGDDRRSRVDRDQGDSLVDPTDTTGNDL